MDHKQNNVDLNDMVFSIDIIKVFNGDHEKSKEVNSKKFEAKLNKHPEVVDENIEIFKNELNILSKQKPILISIGSFTYKILKKNMEGYDIYKIKHYSTWGGADDYRKDVCSVLREI